MGSRVELRKRCSTAELRWLEGRRRETGGSHFIKQSKRTSRRNLCVAIGCNAISAGQTSLEMDAHSFGTPIFKSDIPFAKSGKHGSRKENLNTYLSLG